MVQQTIKVKVYRFNPQKDKESRYMTYDVPFEEMMSILSVIDYIFENLDSSLSYYGSCRRGECSRCYVNVNGKTVKACLEIARGDMTIEPVPRYDLIKDLYVDMEKGLSSTE